MTLTSSLNYRHNAIYITSSSLSIASNTTLLRPRPETLTRNTKASCGPQASTPVLRGEGASKRLPKLLTLKPGSKLFRTELIYDFATCCQVLLRVLVYYMIIYTCLLLYYLVFMPQLSTPLVAKLYVIYTPPINREGLYHINTKK